MNVNELRYYSQRRQEGERERKEETKQSVPSDKCEYGLLGRVGSLSPGILLSGKEARTQG